ncbi:HsmA family protein [Oceanithermus sp.]
MPRDVLLAVIFINLALVFYTGGVWWERLAGELRWPHLALFWAGCAADSAGTEMMYRILGHVEFNLHGVTGLTALSLMLVHAVWATWVLLRGGPEAKRRFHRFSVSVWTIWLVPYLTGYLLSMGGR